jgi:hypothetical protein
MYNAPSANERFAIRGTFSARLVHKKTREAEEGVRTGFVNPVTPEIADLYHSSHVRQSTRVRLKRLTPLR